MQFWDTLPHPFFVLAPMEGVTDHVFRRVVQQAAAPDFYVTEFTNVTAYANEKGRHSTESRLFVEEGEGPVIAQIWGSIPEHFEIMSRDLAASGKYAGIDINFGCPDKSIVKQGACSALIGNEPVVADIIKAAKSGGLPVSVKTRIGIREPITEQWFTFLLKQELAAITVHGRTAKEMSKVPAHWDEIAKVVRLRDAQGVTTKIIGNGDVMDRQHGLLLVNETGVDGIMIGRGIFHEVFAFESTPKEHSPQEYLDLLRLHLDYYEQAQLRGSLASLKRFFKIYIHGFNGAHELRAKLMETKSVEEAKRIIADVVL